MPPLDRRSRGVLAALLLAALAQYGWNLATQRPFVAYDMEGHMHYAATILDEGRVPSPLEGWSSFHPPLYYLLVAGLSWSSAPLWPAGRVEGLSAFALLLAGGVAFRVARRLGHPPSVAAVATALLLFVPCTALAATMVGNEATTAAFAALAAAGGVALQADPRRARVAAATGLCAGLALATKFSGVFALPALVVPYLRRDLDRPALRAGAIGALLLLAVGGLPYLRNLAATGSLLPMTREREPVARVERSLTLRERRIGDYLWLDPAVFRMPVVHLVPEGDDGRSGLNPVMTNVWGLAYASAWYDAHEVRVPDGARLAGVRAARGLLLLGLVPTALLLLGAGLALRDLATRRSAATAPLLGMAVLGGAAFVAFTARAPAAPAVKASYLLPLAVPAAVFFARGVQAFAGGTRRVLLAVSACAALAAGVVFTNGVVFPLHPAPERPEAPWMTAGLAAAAEDLDASSAGRWLGIRAEPLRSDGVRWRFTARTLPALAGPEVRAWCDAIESLMRERAPRQPWRAVFVQGNDRRRCDVPRRDD